MLTNNEKRTIETMTMIKEYANIVCYSDDDPYFIEDLIQDTLLIGIDVINRDKKCRLSSKDIFAGWLKSYFDENYEYHVESMYDNSEEDSSINFGSYTIDSEIEKRELKSILNKIMNKGYFTPNEKYILISYYGLNNSENKTLKEIAAEQDLSAGRIHQIKEKALRKLRWDKDIRSLNVYISSL